MYKIKLSPYHKIFYNEWKLSPNSSKYNIVFDQTLSASLSIKCLKDALSRFVSDHCLINSHILEIEHELYWIPNSHINYLEHFEKDYTHQQIFNYIIKPFNIESEPLYRFAIFKESNGDYRFIIVWHHLLMDGISVDIAIEEISNYYNDKKYKTKYNIEEQQSAINELNEKYHYQLKLYGSQYQNFWDNLLKDVEIVDIKCLKKVASYTVDKNKLQNQIKELRFSIESDDLLRLIKISRYFSITPYIFSQCIFAILIHKYTHQSNFAISYPIAVRGGINFICGVKVNTNLRVYKFDELTTILDLFNQNVNLTRNAKSVGLNAANYPVEKIVENTNKELLNIVFAETNLKDTQFAFVDVITRKVNHEFNLDLSAALFFEQEIKERINFRVRFSTAEIDENIIEDFVKYYKKLFFDVLGDLEYGINDKLISAYSILDQEMYDNLIYGWNKTEQSYPDGKTIHQIFEEQVEKTPDNIALVYDRVCLTYNELNVRANQLAHYLLASQEIKGDDLIILFLDRNEYLLISILAVFKSGGAYVPIDPTYPMEKIEYIIRDSNSKFILTNKINKVKIEKIFDDSNIENHISSTPPSEVIVVDSPGTKKVLSYQKKSNVNTNITSNNLAYAIYTSGTTGMSKGVLIEHKSIVNLIFSIHESYNGTGKHKKSLSQAKIMCFCNYIFDVSVSEFFVTLCRGNELHLLSDSIRQNVDLISNYINEKGINSIYLPPVLLSELLRIKYPTLKNILYAGEPCDTNTALYWSKNYNLYNYYGPTETTIYSTGLKIVNGNSQLIGKPIYNTKVYVLDKDLTPVPIGSIGELYISGIGLARGYLNQSQLTKEKFIDNPFFHCGLEKIYSRMYKTGDLVRLLSDGNIEYIGRNDSQVKVRGYRIELEEITHVISSYPKITNSITLVTDYRHENVKDNSDIDDKSQNKYIVAYYTSEYKLDESEIINYLNMKLPRYMIPNSLIHISKIPMTIQGKLDYKALPIPRLNAKVNFLAPRNDLELTICKAYAEILKLPVKQVGVNHDFFELGGNSILAIRLTTKLQYNFKITLNDVFKLRTPEKLARDAVFIKDNLKYKLEKIKVVYREILNSEINNKIQEDTVYREYISSTRDINFSVRYKPIKNVLLTGATGYLGCNLLYQLLANTKYKIYLLVRSSSDILAYNRVKDKFRFYFNEDVDCYSDRIVVLRSDIEKENLGLDPNTYQKLTSDVDSIIHAAALVKHYGNYDAFYYANVYATINLLEFAKKTALKDFHYISTISVFTDGYVPNHQYYIFNEESNNNILQNKSNFYVQTKYSGEQAVLQYKSLGVKANIYRIGNLSMHSKNYKNQFNIEENSFFIRIKTILNLGMLPEELADVEMSPVDCAAQAIVKLFDQVDLCNNIYHLFNPKVANLLKLFEDYNNINLIVSSIGDFIDTILRQVENTTDNEQIELFMLHQQWLQDINVNHYTKNVVLQNKTEAILDKLNFRWPQITSDMLSDIISQSFKRINKMLNREQILKHVEYMADRIPCALYWLDLNYVVIGVNQRLLKAIGASSRDSIIGKRVYDFYPKHVADSLQHDFQQCVESVQDLEREHVIEDITTGRRRYFAATVSPILDSLGEIIGVIGTSIETTIEREAKQLKLENEAHKAVAEEQNKFRKIVDQVSHDIRSPISTLLMVVNSAKATKEIPEDTRVTIRNSAIRINDIANHLLSHYDRKEVVDNREEKVRFLISAALQQVLTEKRYEYQKLKVTFDHNFSQSATFAFINMSQTAFKQMVSNLINNSVEALEGKDGTVTVHLEADNDGVKVIVEDNGKGMTSEVVNKIMEDITVTSDKMGGHGIGLTQVRDAIKQGEGSILFDSELGVGTKVILSFPRVESPAWIAEKIELNQDDLIIILDDDPTIHGAWQTRFKIDAPQMRLKHFDRGEEAVRYINNLSPEEKEKILLLTDYELLEQGLHGLNVIERTQVKRSILVTSHADNINVRKLAEITKTKILPKILASDIPIKVRLDIKSNSINTQFDMIIVDDDKFFVDAFCNSMFTHKKIASYQDPVEFLDHVLKYPKDIVICLDNNYKNFDLTGLDVANIVHGFGYTNLYMLSGSDFTNRSVPNYLKVILKTDIDSIEKIA